jgi:hypothetical protein
MMPEEEEEAVEEEAVKILKYISKHSYLQSQ